MDDRANGDQTWIDLPMCMPVNVVSGNASIKTSYTAMQNDAGQPGLQKCGVFEVVSIALYDGNGDWFGVPGLLLQ